MAQDRNGNNHKAAGRPDGGQFDKKAGQGTDDDLDFGGYVAGMDAAADRTAIKERPETLSADDWRALRRSASWGVRMLAWSSPKSPTPTDDEFDELLYDESQRVRGAAAYRDDLTEAQVEALLHDGNPNVRRKAVMSRNAARKSVERMARLDNNGFVRGTADFRLDPAGHAETGDRTHDAVYGGVERISALPMVSQTINRSDALARFLSLPHRGTSSATGASTSVGRSYAFTQSHSRTYSSGVQVALVIMHMPAATALPWV